MNIYNHLCALIGKTLIIAFLAFHYRNLIKTHRWSIYKTLATHLNSTGISVYGKGSRLSDFSLSFLGRLQK